MRELLYITPYFPPQSQVGALRPLKFVRHLPALGWLPVVLADLWPSDAVDVSLRAEVPAEVPVIFDYSHRAARTLLALPERQAHAKTAPRRKIDWERYLPSWLNRPELLPLAEHSPDMLYAYRSGLRVLQAHPKIEVLLVNADPWAACLVGAALARKTGLPLVLDLRDPWAPCELRRPRKPFPIRWIDDRLERQAVQKAERVIVNSRTALADYRRHYADQPPEKFTFIRNHFDRALVSHGSHMGFDRFTLLILGRFDRYVRPDVLLHALAQLAARGVGPAELQLVVTGAFDEAGQSLAKSLHVEQFLHLTDHVPYAQVGAVMHAADVLVAVLQPGVSQRVNAKLYDYLGTDRPILVVADSEEVREIVNQAGGGQVLAHGQPAALADAVVALMRQGRRRCEARNSEAFSSQTATLALTQVLDAAVTAMQARVQGRIAQDAGDLAQATKENP